MNDFKPGDIVLSIEHIIASIGAGYGGKMGYGPTAKRFKIEKIQKDGYVELIPEDPKDGSFEYRGWKLSVHKDFHHKFKKEKE